MAFLRDAAARLTWSQLPPEGLTCSRLVILATVGSLALTGCAAAMAVSALDLAVRSAQPRPTSNAELKPQAEQQCMAQAARYGTPRVIDVQQAKINKIIVWGTVNDGSKTLSFQCDYGTKVTGFRLRPIDRRADPPAPRS